VNVVRFLEGRPIAQTIDVADILTRGRLEKNYELKSGDWMYVHKKFTINWSIVIQTLTLAVAAVNLYYTIDHLKQ
jgi:hypothetical protein